MRCTALLYKRLEHLRRHHPHIKTVPFGTSGQSRGFFARFGFEITSVTPDGYAPGLDHYDMTLSREKREHLLSP